MATATLVNVKYSPNLGDGVIAECLEAALAKAGVTAGSLDVAGRGAFGDVTVSNRKLVLTVLGALPAPARRGLVRAKMSRLFAAKREEWLATLRASDLAIIGGGHLFADADLNFPLKVGEIAKLCKEVGTPVAVYAVGVAGEWSAPGAELFRHLLDADVRGVFVRDAASAANWATHFKGTPLENAAVCFDPGVLAAEVYPRPAPPAEPRARRMVGVCVTDPGLLSYHADMGVAGAEGGLGAFFTALVKALIAADCDVTLFTNGAGEDEAFLAGVYDDEALAAERGTRLLRAPTPSTPGDVAAAIAACDGVVAHRLHANIVSFSYAIPGVGLAWDKKVKSFFERVGRGGYLAEAGAGAEQTAALALRAMDEGLDREAHAAALATAWDEIHALAGLVKAARPETAGAAS